MPVLILMSTLNRHRLSTIMNAHTIIVLQEGKIIELGNHDTLLAAQGKYHSLWSKHIKNDGLSPDTDLLIDDNIPEETKKVAVAEDVKEVTESANTSDLSGVEFSKESATKSSNTKASTENHGMKGAVSNNKNDDSLMSRGQKLPGLNDKNLEPKLATSLKPVAPLPERPEDVSFVPGSKPSLPKIMTSNLKPDAPVFTPGGVKTSSMSASTASPVMRTPWTAGPSASDSILQSSNATSPEDTKTPKGPRNVGSQTTDNNDSSKPSENIDQTAGKQIRPPKQNKNRHKKPNTRKELTKVITNEMEETQKDNTTQTKVENPKRSKGNNPSAQCRGKQQKVHDLNNKTDSQQQHTEVPSTGEGLSIKMPVEESSAPSGEPCSTSSSLPKINQPDSTNKHPGRANNSRRSGNRRISLGSNSIKDKFHRRRGSHASSPTESKVEQNIPAEAGGTAASGGNPTGTKHK